MNKNEKLNFIKTNIFAAILVFYLKYKLGFSENDATVLYHALMVASVLISIFGAVLPDICLGKFKFLLYLSLLDAIGSIILSDGAIPGFLLSPKTALYIGLILIVCGNGVLCGCTILFGGDQFKLPEQNTQMATYFSMYFFAFHAGSFIASTFTPILRADVQCFGESDCYSLAFGVPALLMVVAICKYY